MIVVILFWQGTIQWSSFTYNLGKNSLVTSEKLSHKLTCYIKLFPLWWSSWISYWHKKKKKKQQKTKQTNKKHLLQFTTSISDVISEKKIYMWQILDAKWWWSKHKRLIFMVLYIKKFSNIYLPWRHQVLL